MALILLIDTSGEKGFVALSEKGNGIARLELPDPRLQAAVLQPLIAELCAMEGKKVTDLEAVSVVSGPGSYTGLRVGMASAKGLCFALDIPLLLPDKLLLLALTAHQQGITAGKPVWVLLPARVGEWFAGCFAPGGGVEVPPQHWEEKELEHLLLRYTENTIVISEISGKEKITIKDTWKIVEYINVDVFAKECYTLFVNKCFSDSVKAVPLYLKPAFTIK